MIDDDWVGEFPDAITVCDPGVFVQAMNARAG